MKHIYYKWTVSTFSSSGLSIGYQWKIYLNTLCYSYNCLPAGLTTLRDTNSQKKNSFAITKSSFENIVKFFTSPVIIVLQKNKKNLQSIYYCIWIFVYKKMCITDTVIKLTNQPNSDDKLSKNLRNTNKNKIDF